jgi:hypothetical protein
MVIGSTGFEFSKRELQPSNLKIRDFYHPEDQSATANTLQSIGSQGKQSSRFVNSVPPITHTSGIEIRAEPVQC